MSAEFYDRNGEVRVRLTSGGHGGGITGTVDVLATDELKAQHAAAFLAFTEAKAVVPEPDAAAVVEPEPAPVTKPTEPPVVPTV